MLKKQNDIKLLRCKFNELIAYAEPIVINNLLQNFEILKLVANGSLSYNAVSVVLAEKRVEVFSREVIECGGQKVTISILSSGIMIGGKLIRGERGVLLTLLYKNKCKAVPKKEILQLLYPETDTSLAMDRLYQLCSRLNKYLSKYSLCIKSVRKKGYLLNAKD